MKLRYDNTPEDLLAFWSHHQRRRQAAQDMLIWNIGSGVLAFLILDALLRAFAGGITPGHQTIIAGALTAAWFLAAPHYRRRRLLDLARGEYSGLIGEHELEIQPELLLARRPGSEVRSQWSHIQRIDADPMRTYLYINAVSAHIIPAAGVREGDYTAFVQAAREHLAAAPRTATPPPPAPAAGTPPALRRILGAIMLLIGLCLATPVLLVIWSILLHAMPVAGSPLLTLGVLSLVAVFCLLIGYRLAFNRPNKRGTLFGSLVWRGLAALILAGTLAAALPQLWIEPDSFTDAVPMLLFGGLLAWVCWRAGGDDGEPA